jgi:hypothetical protein
MLIYYSKEFYNINNIYKEKYYVLSSFISANCLIYLIISYNFRDYFISSKWKKYFVNLIIMTF